jgi:hypothetical protein
MVDAYRQIGRRIVEEEQGGEVRAEYGSQLIRNLARALGDEFGRGFSVANLWNFRQFYLTFPDAGKLYALSRELNWTHWRLVMRVENAPPATTTSGSAPSRLSPRAAWSAKSRPAPSTASWSVRPRRQPQSRPMPNRPSGQRSSSAWSQHPEFRCQLPEFGFELPEDREAMEIWMTLSAPSAPSAMR